MYLTTLSCRKFLRSARPDPSQGEHVGECCDNKLGRQRRHRVADLATHSRVDGPRFSLAWPAAVLEYEFIREALQTSLLPVAQTPGLGVVIAVSATTATCDYRVRGLVWLQPAVHVAYQTTYRKRMPVWDDFVVAPWRNQFESLNDVRAVKPDLMVRRIWRQRISVQGFADSDGNPGEGSGDDRRAHAEISAHADHDQPHPVLGNSEVGHVDDLRAKVVTYGRATLLLASKEDYLKVLS